MTKPIKDKNNNLIIIVNGAGGVGKDTFIDCVVCNFTKFTSPYKEVVRLSTVDIIKDVAKILGWDGSKDEPSRKFLSDLKNLSSEYNNFPTKYILNKISELNNTIVFVMCREPKEIKKLVEQVGAITLLIDNPRIPLITSNSADANVMKYDYDFIVCNSGSIKELSENAYSFLQMLLS